MVTVDFPVTATAMMVLVWAAATGSADSRVLSMVHTAAMASAAMALAATHMADSEVFTAKASQVLSVPLDLALSYLLDLHAVEADQAGAAEQDRVQVDQAPALAAALDPVRSKL